jgi:hypothetical protein
LITTCQADDMNASFGSEPKASLSPYTTTAKLSR